MTTCFYHLIGIDRLTGKRTPYTYKGMTQDMSKRLRQHNGHIAGGARYTTMRLQTMRWVPLLTVTGFTTRGSVHSFETLSKSGRGSYRRAHRTVHYTRSQLGLPSLAILVEALSCNNFSAQYTNTFTECNLVVTLWHEFAAHHMPALPAVCNRRLQDHSKHMQDILKFVMNPQQLRCKVFE
jgi:predicted GIY-YIG superfamily endonuclease